jgi:hypothetical protein
MDEEHLIDLPPIEGDNGSAKQTVQEIMQKLQCSESEAEFILSIERGEITGDIEVIDEEKQGL